MIEETDAAWLVAAAQGDAAAFAALVGKYGDILLNFFLRKGVSYADGQDLVQKTFLRVWRYRNRYTLRAKFTTFLFMLAGQVAVDFFRAEGRRRTMTEDLAREAEQEAAVRHDPAAEAGEAVRRAVARLPPPMRDVVELGVFQDLPYADVSEILGIPVGTVKSRMFNALKKLKEMLG